MLEAVDRAMARGRKTGGTPKTGGRQRGSAPKQKAWKLTGGQLIARMGRMNALELVERIMWEREAKGDWWRYGTSCYLRQSTHPRMTPSW